MHDMAQASADQLASAKLVAARARDLLEATGVPEEQVVAFLKDGNLAAVTVGRSGGRAAPGAIRSSRTLFQPQMLARQSASVADVGA